MVSLIIKALFFLFLVSFLRTLWNSYKVVKTIRNNNQNNGQNQSRKKNDDNVVEAEYRHLD